MACIKPCRSQANQVLQAHLLHSSAITVDVVVTDSSASASVFIVKAATIPVGGALVPIGGDQKVVLETTDILKVTSNTASSADVIVSVLQQT